MSILNVMKTKKEFQVEFMYQKVNVRYNYFGLNSVMDESRLPIISHIEFLCSTQFRAFTDTGYRSFFFHPPTLENYTDTISLAIDILKILSQEKSNSGVPDEKNIHKQKEGQLSLF